MRIFSYLSRGQVRCARVIDKLGIDVYKSSDSFQRNTSTKFIPSDGLPISLTDLLLFGSEGMELLKEATEWVLGSMPKYGDEFYENGTIFAINEVTYVAPIPRPGKVICIAGNYPAPDKMEKPEYPTVFLKPCGGVIGHQQPIVIPRVAESVAYEVELAVVIGRRSKNLSAEEALSAVAGYTIANDIGDRLLEKRTSQWTSGKMFDTFTPMGPIMVTPDELSNPGNVEISTRVNDQIVQKGNTSQMFFNVPQLISYLSTLTTLEPGDVILTGSPKLMDGEPNPAVMLKPGDVVTVSIEHLSTLTNPVIAEYEGVL